MPLSIGTPAPDFTLADEQGEQVTLSELRGRNVVLVFYPLDFSPTCTGELKDITRLHERFGDAEVFGISVDSKWAHAAFRRDEELAVRLLADFHPKGAVARLYDAWIEPAGIATRATYVIDGEGIIRGVSATDPGTARDQDEAIAALATCAI